MSQKHVRTVPGRYEEVKNICAFMVQGAEEAGLDESALFQVELACDEACTNIIEHAYGGEGRGDIVASWQIDGNDFIMRLHDNGRVFNPDDVPDPTMPNQLTGEAALDSLQVGGLGIHFMRKLMDEIRYQFDPDQGNTLILVKKISQE